MFKRAMTTALRRTSQSALRATMASPAPLSNGLRTGLVAGSLRVRDLNSSTETGVPLKRPITEIEESNLTAAYLYNKLKDQGTTYFAGVPDSLLKDICAYITDNTPSTHHFISANEGTAMGSAAGHHLATGQIPVVYLQNSGLGNIVNPLLSLHDPKVYAIPTLLLIGWRGEPGKKDEPQHMVQGGITPDMLKAMGVAHALLPDFEEGADKAIDEAYAYMRENNAPFALLVKKKTFLKYKATTKVETSQDRSKWLKREEVLEKITQVFRDTPLVTTTGFTSREVFELRVKNGEGHAHDFLTVGSMGHCSSIALGVASSAPNDVLCVDGDGAALMHLGAMPIAGASGLKNFKHVLVNNGMHDSVGGQPTTGFNIDWPLMAKACGYKYTATASTAGDVTGALEALQQAEGPAFLEVKAKPGSRPELGRPTTTTKQNKESFMANMEKSR